MRLDARARQDVAILGSGFLKLDGKFVEHFVCSHNYRNPIFVIRCALAGTLLVFKMFLELGGENIASFFLLLFFLVSHVERLNRYTSCRDISLPHSLSLFYPPRSRFIYF